MRAGDWAKHASNDVKTDPGVGYYRLAESSRYGAAFNRQHAERPIISESLASKFTTALPVDGNSIVSLCQFIGSSGFDLFDHSMRGRTAKIPSTRSFGRSDFNRIASRDWTAHDQHGMVRNGVSSC